MQTNGAEQAGTTPGMTTIDQMETRTRAKPKMWSDTGSQKFPRARGSIAPASGTVNDLTSSKERRCVELVPIIDAENGVKSREPPARDITMTRRRR